jgi:hypothetical protein
MPRHYPVGLRHRTCERMLAGEAVKDLVIELEISSVTLLSCLESTSSADVDRDLSVLGLEYRPSAQFVVPSLLQNGRGQLTFRPGDPHTQNKSDPHTQNKRSAALWPKTVKKCGANVVMR